MRDPLVEKQIRLISLFLDSWKRLNVLLAYSFGQEKQPITIEQERDFTNLRSWLLEEHEHILHQLGLEKAHYEQARAVLTSAVSMQRSRQLPPAEIQKIETAWNTIFTRLELLLGQLKVRKNQLAPRSATLHALSRLARNTTFRIIFAILLIFTAFYYCKVFLLP